MSLKINIKFINENHENNYLELTEKYEDKNSQEYLTAFKLISIDDIYKIAKDYLNPLSINFSNLLKDNRLTNDERLICKVAYEIYGVSSDIDLSNIRMLEDKKRKYVLANIYNYTLEKWEA
ncbi:hypothetical protein [Clostridium sp.]|uniref:hypothetical protein n=1 Tax=Clostridium sp. TaxID=1506 RepID=UPI003F373D09